MTDDAVQAVWTPEFLPSVVILQSTSRQATPWQTTPLDLRADAASAPLSLSRLGPAADLAVVGPIDLVLTADPSPIRVRLLDAPGPVAVVLPVDALFATRLRSAARLWRYLDGGDPGPSPQRLPLNRRRRLVQALRTLDARRDGASYRQVAEALFGADRVAGRGWKTHPLRDQTVRLARLGEATMRGGYRQLLLHPWRRNS